MLGAIEKALREEREMRNEKEMFELILNTAKEDERIYAVYMNGSRTNPNVPKDIFQDYDIVYVVDRTEPYINDKNWINRFGEILFMQYPDENIYCSSDKQNFYGWLIQFTDGNRLDLHVESLEHAKANILKDKLCKILLDKENVLPDVGESTDKGYWVEKPNEQQFLCTCNEFWWCLNNVAKGLWRKEVPYVQDMINYNVRPQLIKVLSWKIGIDSDFSCSIGKSGKYMYRYLTAEEWKLFLRTYVSADVEEMWNGIMTMCRLFDETAKDVGERLGFCYNQNEADNCMSFMEHVRKLPEDATEIYDYQRI